MSLEDEAILDLIPKPVTTNEEIPAACSVAQMYPNVVLRNDGFNANAVYTFDNFYATFANILGNMERMQVDGGVLQVIQDAQAGQLIDVRLLYDARKLLTSGFTLGESGMRFFQQPGVPPGILHQQPELWSYNGQVTDNLAVRFRPVYDLPINYTLHTKRTPGAEERNLDAPSVVIAYGYGRRAVLDYVYRNYKNPPANEEHNPISNDLIVDGLRLLAREVSGKMASLKGLK